VVKINPLPSSVFLSPDKAAPQCEIRDFLISFATLLQSYEYFSKLPNFRATFFELFSFFFPPRRRWLHPTVLANPTARLSQLNKPS
jgi:hypothetical protein